MENTPNEIMEAAYIDGADVWDVYHRIALPLASPAIASVSIFNFLTAWEEYPWANTVIYDNSRRTLPIAIAGFFGQHQFTQWGYVFAMSVLSLIPVVVIFILCQKYFVSGLTAGSVKGCFFYCSDFAELRRQFCLFTDSTYRLYLQKSGLVSFVMLHFM